MKKASVRKNYVYNMIYEVVSLLVPLITTPYTSRVLGAEGIGSYSFSYSVVRYFVVFAMLGTTLYGRREIACRQNEDYERSRLFIELMVFRFCSVCLAIILYLSYIFLRSYSLIGAVMVIQLVDAFLDVTWFYQGMEQFGKLVIRNICVKLLWVIFIFTCVKTADDLILYIVGSAAISIGAGLILLIGTRRYVLFRSIRKMNPFRHFKGALMLFLPTVASQIYQTLDKTMIGVYTVTSVENGYYEQAQKMIVICGATVTTYALVAAPRMALAFSDGNKKELNKLLKKSVRFVCFLSVPVMLGLAAVSDNFVPWFFGKEFDKVRSLLHILSYIVLPMGINAVGAQFLIASKQQKAYNVVIVLGTLANFILNAVMIPAYYSVGASVASVAAEYSIMLILLCIIIRDSDLAVCELFEGVYKYLIAGGIMCVCVRTAGAFMASSFASTAALVMMGGAAYFLCLLLLRDEMIKTGLEVMISRIKGNNH